MAKSIIAHPAHKSTEKEKAASCSDWGDRCPRRELREVGPDETSWSLTVCEAPRRCVGLALVDIGCFDAQRVCNALLGGGAGLCRTNSGVVAALGQLLSYP
jgi:hypothetical protein